MLGFRQIPYLLLALTVALPGCALNTGLQARTATSTAMEADAAAVQVKTVKTPFGTVTLGLLPNRLKALGTDDSAPSYESEIGLTGGLSIQGQSLPSSVDLRPYCSPIRNQGNLGSCSAFATTGIMEAMMNIQGKGSALSKIGHLSTLFFYYAERKVMEDTGRIAHATKKDTGAFLDIAAKTAVKVGAPAEDAVPYKDGRPALAYDATDADYQAAAAFKSATFSKISTLQGMKSALASKHPFLIGIACYPSFMTKEVAQSGVMPVPSRTEQPEGGHALAVVGYDDAKGAFLVRNSWGTDWGQKGYFWMPYEFFKPTYIGYSDYFSCYVLN